MLAHRINPEPGKGGHVLAQCSSARHKVAREHRLKEVPQVGSTAQWVGHQGTWVLFFVLLGACCVITGKSFPHAVPWFPPL